MDTGLAWLDYQMAVRAWEVCFLTASVAIVGMAAGWWIAKHDDE